MFTLSEGTICDLVMAPKGPACGLVRISKLGGACPAGSDISHNNYKGLKSVTHETADVISLS
jgi:hypothetical protein